MPRIYKHDIVHTYKYKHVCALKYDGTSLNVAEQRMGWNINTYICIF